MRLFVCAGEASGDRILAALLAGLRARVPGLEVRGAFGPLSKADASLEGVESVFPLRGLAVNGIADVLRAGPSLWRARARLLRELRTFRPDRVLLVDYPGMNVPLARAARSLGIPVHYVAPPQLWAYRDPSARLRRLRAALEGVSLQVLFPFEADAYAHWIPAIRQGHFFAAHVPPGDTARAGRLLLCPGSRLGVLRRNLPPWLARLRAAGYPAESLDVLVPEFLVDEARAICDDSSTILTDRDAAFARAGAAIAFPGTITLELLLRRVPTRVWAVLDAPTLWLGRGKLRGPFVALANVLAGAEVFPEWIGTARDFRNDSPAVPPPNETWPAVENPQAAAAWEKMGSDQGVATGVAACLGDVPGA